MTEETTILFCPKCGQRYKEAKTTFDITKPLTCAACGQSFGVDELKTDSGQTLPEYIASNPFPANDDDQWPARIRILLYVAAVLAGAVLAWLIAQFWE